MHRFMFFALVLTSALSVGCDKNSGGNPIAPATYIPLGQSAISNVDVTPVQNSVVDPSCILSPSMTSSFRPGCPTVTITFDPNLDPAVKLDRDYVGNVCFSSITDLVDGMCTTTSVAVLGPQQPPVTRTGVGYVITFIIHDSVHRGLSPYRRSDGTFSIPPDSDTFGTTKIKPWPLVIPS